MSDKPTQQRPRISSRLRWLVWSAYVIAWTWSLEIPNPAVTGENHELRHSLFLFSKALHVAAYCVLTVLSACLCVPRRYRWLLLVFISVHGMATEYFQQFVPTRTGSWRDVGLDHLGLVLGVLFSWKLWWRRP